MTYNPPPPDWSDQPYSGVPPATSPPGHQAQSKAFFGALFDFGFNHFVTPSIVRVLYVLGLVGIVLSYLFFVISAFANDAVSGIIVLLLGWIPALIYVTFWRVMLEFFLAVVRMSEDVHHRGSGGTH